LADKIKHVEEHHLLELIQIHRSQEGRSTAGRILQGHVGTTPVVAGQSYIHTSMPVPHAAEHNSPFHPAIDHHADQEDYLWGV